MKMKTPAVIKIAFGILIFGLFLFFGAIWQNAGAQSSLDALKIDFGSPYAVLPLDRHLPHRFTVKNTSGSSLTVRFRIFVKDTNQEIVGWPQPQFLYLDPGEEKLVETFLDEMWGRLDRNSSGNYMRNVEWTFTDEKSGVTRREDVVYRFSVLAPNKITGDLKVSGKVSDAKQKPIRDAEVILSTGPGGWQTSARTKSDGSFSFPGVPKRDDWVLEARGAGGRAFAIVDSGKAATYVLTLRKPALSANYKITKTEKTEIGFWDGDVDEKEQYVVLTNGMENWRNPNLKPRSKLYFYTLDGELKWTYDMGWEAWGVSLSRDGKYVAFVTSSPTKNLGLINASSGKPLWVKDAFDFKPMGPLREIDSRKIKISSTGAYVGLGSGDGTIFLLELKSGRILWRQFLKGQVRGIAFNKDDGYVYAGSGDGNAYKLNVGDGSIIWKADIGSWPFSFKLSRDETLLAAGGKFGEATVIDAKTGKKLWQEYQKGTVTWLDFSPDGKYLIAGGGGQGATSLYEARTGKKIWRINEFSHQGQFLADSRFILIGDRDLKIVDLNGNELQILKAFSFDAGQGQFAYISKDKSKIIFTTRDINALTASIAFAKGTIKALAAEEAEPIAADGFRAPAGEAQSQPSIVPPESSAPSAELPLATPSKRPGGFFEWFKNFLRAIFGIAK